MFPILSQTAWLEAVFVVCLGLIVGSFVNVVIYRLPRGTSIVFPRSRCTACGEPIAPYDNIPVLSYVFLRGRCRQCRAAVSLRYPVVELLVGGASLIVYFRHGFGLEYAAEFGFVAAMVILVFVDYDHRILPDAVTLPGTAAGLLLAGPREGVMFVESASGAILGAGLLLLVAQVYFHIRDKEGLGMGDVKMMAMVGAFLGWKGVLLTLFLGSFLGSVIGLGVMWLRGGDMQTKLPFGTFLGVAATAALFTGSPLIDWYSGLF